MKIALEEEEEEVDQDVIAAIPADLPIVNATPDWLMEDDAEDKSSMRCNNGSGMDDDNSNKENIPPALFSEIRAPSKHPTFSNISMPLLDYLCATYHCSLKELQVLFNSLERRREIVTHLRREVVLRTCHLRPPERNFTIRFADMTAQPASSVPALNGYLGITVNK